MGSDQRVVKAARVSFASDEKTFSKDRDVRLIKYLYEHKHASPFEHVVLAFKMKKRDYIKLLRKTMNKVHFQAFWEKDYVVMNLRHLINVYKRYPQLIPGEVIEAVKVKLPAVYNIVFTESVQNIDCVEYSVDTANPIFEEEIYYKKSYAGKIELLDVLTANSEKKTNLRLYDYYTFVVECPLFVARQWFRHRFGSFNEVSRRYVNYGLKFYTPPFLRMQAIDNKQASVNKSIDKKLNNTLLDEINNMLSLSNELYNKLIENNAAKEIARGVLPQCMFTRFYWTVPKVSLANFVALRNSESAQVEIRLFAKIIAKHVKKLQSSAKVIVF